MNRIFIINFFVLIFFSQQVLAQVEKGNYILGGNTGLDNLTNAGGNTVTTIFMSPMYGAFLTDRFLVGGSAYLNYQYFARTANTNLRLGPLVRFYFNNIFLQGDYSFGIPNRSYFEHDVFARLGYTYFLNEHVAIEPYVFIGYRDLVYRRGSSNYGYLDDGIYFSIQVYIESALNKAMKIHKVKLRGKQ